MQFWANSELVACADDPSLVDEVNEFLADNHLHGKCLLINKIASRTEKFISLLPRAKGKWLVVFDADDELPNGALSVLDICLKACPKKDYFTSEQLHINVSGDALRSLPALPQDNTLNALLYDFRQKHLWGFKRESLSSFSVALRSPFICEDYFFFATLALRGLMPLCIPFILCRYRRHTQQLTQIESAAIIDMTKRIQNRLQKEVDKTYEGILLRSEMEVERALKEQDVMRDAVRLDYIDF